MRTIEAGGAGSGRSTARTSSGRSRNGLADVPPDRIGAVIMLTDGQVHDVPASAPASPPARRCTSCSPATTASATAASSSTARRASASSARSRRSSSASSTTASPRRRRAVRVTVTRDGKPLSTEPVTPGEPGELTVDITHGGPNIIEFEAEPLAGELTPINNRAVAAIEGIRENLRVLLVSGEPHAGERTWRNLLKSDASVDLVHFTILRPPEKQDGTPINELSLIAFPTRELFSEKIDQFDLIIFDRYQHRGVLPILYFDNIARYVRDGGAVLVAAGPDYANDGSLYDTPLSPVLPAAPTGKIIEEPFFAARHRCRQAPSGDARSRRRRVPTRRTGAAGSA